MQTQTIERAFNSDRKIVDAIQYYERARIHTPFTDTTRRQRMLIAWRFRSLFRHLVRRGFDCTVASLLLIAILPILLVTAIAIKLESPGPIIFRQKRIGKHGTTFTLYKFRSMSVDAEQRKRALLTQNEVSGPFFKMKQDPRVTNVGAIIRKFSIDELPQLVNVLKGDMNLVGPRPPVPDEVASYKIDHLRRLEVTPGITGLAQIMGRSDLDFETWVQLDRQYITQQSLRTDIEILVKTVPSVLLGRGAY